MTQQVILRQIQMMPPSLQKEVLDFIGFLFEKYHLEQTTSKQKRPKFGSAKGKYQMAPDFDAPLDDFNEYMQ